MRKLTIPAIVAVTILMIWLFSDREAVDTFPDLSVETDALRTASPDVATHTQGINSGASSRVQETGNHIQEAAAADTNSEAQARIAGKPFLAEAQERVITECKPSRNFIDFEAFQCAIEFEALDSNWGPLVEAQVMSSVSESQANLLSVTVQCKTTICRVKIRQVETPLLEDKDNLPGWRDEDPRATFTAWWRDLSKSLDAAELEVSRIDLVPPVGEAGIMTWGLWIQRVPYY